MKLVMWHGVHTAVLPRAYCDLICREPLIHWYNPARSLTSTSFVVNELGVTLAPPFPDMDSLHGAQRARLLPVHFGVLAEVCCQLSGDNLILASGRHSMLMDSWAPTSYNTYIYEHLEIGPLMSIDRLLLHHFGWALIRKYMETSCFVLSCTSLQKNMQFLRSF